MNELFSGSGYKDQATSPDQRRHRRYGVKLPCRVKPRESLGGNGIVQLEGETLDVSSGGMFFLTSAGWSVGTAIDFELDLPVNVVRNPVKIQCQGTITRVVPQTGGRMGIGATIDRYRISPLGKTSKR